MQCTVHVDAEEVEEEKEDAEEDVDVMGIVVSVCKESTS